MPRFDDHFMPPFVTLDTNLLYDLAEGREGVSDVKAILELARSKKLSLFCTATTDFEDKSGVASSVFVQLKAEGVLRESPNAGHHCDYMPGGSGLHIVEDVECYDMLSCLWPTKSWRGASDNERCDVYHLLAHSRNNHEIFLTKDRGILRKRKDLQNRFRINVMAPEELLLRVSDTLRNGSPEREIREMGDRIG